MLKKSITYMTFNDEEVTEDFYFHLSKADIIKLNLSHDGGLEGWVKRVQETEDVNAVVTELEKMVLNSFGKKSDDGRRFVKDPEALADFKSSPAWDELFVELVTNPEKTAQFVAGLIPKGPDSEAVQTEIEKVRAMAQADARKADQDQEDKKNVFEEGNQPRVLTREEAVAMDDSELKSGLMSGRYQLPG